MLQYYVCYLCITADVNQVITLALMHLTTYFSGNVAQCNLFRSNLGSENYTPHASNFSHVDGWVTILLAAIFSSQLLCYDAN
jgi:hypothetical protein